ncbi:IS110 family transposase [Nonlabens sp. SCSIO 43208]|uniref:IS110 family transposase n=1 Tax=Nonlabens sp. SCSIO 43208 TaxID=2793009 RepID=UPI003D6B2E63
MTKSTMIFGIDISKDTFDVYNVQTGYSQYRNTVKGITSFAKALPETAICVMEATGCYHHRLAMGLFDQGIAVSVVNPLVIKRYTQMKLRRIKTDKSDAFMIYSYGTEQELELWRPDAGYVVKGREILSLLQMYLKQSTSLKNKLHALNSVHDKRSKVIVSITRQLRNLKKECKLLEAELLALIKDNEASLFSRLKTIPGIGDKTAILLMLSTNCFKDFASYKQVSSFLGLAPNERSSGSSVRGKTRISKTGDGLVRNHLFMCSFTACIHNIPCKELFDRIVAKGKSKKLALIAVCNKLIKQAFAIAKSGLCYDPNYARN